MGTISDKLNYLNATKTAIKNAIKEKGGTVEESDSFRDYANKILSIETGNPELENILTALIDKSIVNITIPETINRIGEYLFKDCLNLETVNLNNVTELAGSIFYNCKKLSGIDLSNIRKIESSCFSNCSSLTSINLSNLEELGSYVFSGCTALSGAITAPTLTAISNSAFANCPNITSIEFPNAANAGMYAFQNCTNLKNAIVTSIVVADMYSFADCTNLKKVELGATDIISMSAFQNCTSLSDINLNQVKQIKSSAFSGCTALTKLDLSGIQMLSTGAFQNCTNLKYVWLPSTCTTIDGNSWSQSPFKGCSSNLKIYTDVKSSSEIPAGWKQYWNSLDVSSQATVKYNSSLSTMEWDILLS